MRASSTLAFALLLSSASIAQADPSALVGHPAPAIRARPLDADAEVGLDAWRGRVVVVVFVATWCGACRRLAPELEGLREAHAGDGLAVVALSHEDRARIRRHVARRDDARAIPWLQCTGHTAVEWEAGALPTAVVVGRDGVVRAAFQGVEPATVAALRRAVRAALAER